MKKLLLIIILIFFSSDLNASDKEKIIKNLNSINNFSFNFEQNINGKIENGSCIIEYPKKIYCKYNLKNKKVLVSNGKYLVIKTINSYFIYPIEKTPLDYILNKNFLLNKIERLKGRDVDGKFINFTFIENENRLNIFFDKENYNLIGWQSLDLYQNLSITFISSIKKNINIQKKIFLLPMQD